MKKSKSLVLAFTAATALFGGAAMAQTAGAPPAPDDSAIVQPAVPAALPQVGIQDVYNFAYNVGVQTAYPLAGRGFAQGALLSGQHVGIEFNLTDSQYSVRGTYNLDTKEGSDAFQKAVNSAARTEQALEAARVEPIIYPDSYVICTPPVAVIGFGFGIYGWSPVWVPEVVVWDNFGYRGGIGYHGGFDGGRRHDVIIEKTVIERPVGRVDHPVEFRDRDAHVAPPRRDVHPHK